MSPVPVPPPFSLDNAIECPKAKGNKSFVLHKVDDTSFEDRPVKPPGPDEVQVNIRQTGICGSDGESRFYSKDLKGEHAL